MSKPTSSDNDTAATLDVTPYLGEIRERAYEKGYADGAHLILLLDKIEEQQREIAHVAKLIAHAYEMKLKDQTEIERLTRCLEIRREEVDGLNESVKRLREMLWETRHCGTCGTDYRYNRADEPNGQAALRRHLIDSPACEIPF